MATDDPTGGPEADAESDPAGDGSSSAQTDYQLGSETGPGTAQHREPPAAQLPAEYDALLPAAQLVHGEHNPRQVVPTPALRRSIASSGLQRPLIIQPVPDGGDRCQVTDGWQRYQAATDLGWEQLPVQLYEEALAALDATETASMSGSDSPTSGPVLSVRRR